MKFTIDEFIAAAEKEVAEWKQPSDKPRTDFDYEHLGFVNKVGKRMLAEYKEPVKQNGTFIVAEISKSWKADTPVTNLLSNMFESVINVNHERGYSLKEWKVYAANDGTVMTETIIAIFQRQDPVPNMN